LKNSTHLGTCFIITVVLLVTDVHFVWRGVVEERLMIIFLSLKILYLT
jgi:hypothetical protein